MNRLDFAGRAAVITGGAAGIGYAVAQRLIASGARVALWDRDAAALAAAKASLGDAAVTLRARRRRFRRRRSGDARSARSAGQHRRPRVLGGHHRPEQGRWDYPVDEWKKVFDVNVHGLFYCNRAVVPAMRERNYGRIVNIASVAGKEGNPNASAYSASKAAVIGLTKSLGKELAQTNIRVNCVTPAAVRTAIFDQMTQQHIDFMLSKIPLGRFGTVDEIAAMVCWLASEDCSFSTGAVFDLSGGRATY